MRVSDKYIRISYWPFDHKQIYKWSIQAGGKKILFSSLEDAHSYRRRVIEFCLKHRHFLSEKQIGLCDKRAQNRIHN